MADYDKAPWLFRQIETYGESCALLMPNGWVVSIFGASIHTLSPNWWYALIPLFGLALSMPFALRSLERRFSFENFLAMDWSAYVCDSSDEEDEPKNAPARAPGRTANTAGTLSATVDMDDIRRHWAFSFETSRVSWLERLCIRWLSPQEKVTLEDITRWFPRWTPSIRFALLLWLVSVPLFVFTIGYDIPKLAAIALYIAIGIPFVIIFPPFTDITVTAVTYGSVYPFSLPQFFRIRQKATLVRCILAVPIYLAAGYIIVHINDWSIQQYLFISVKTLLMLTLGFPYVPYVRCNPTPLPFGKASFRFFAGFGFVILFLVLMVLCFLTPPVISCICVLLFIALCRLWQPIFIALYDRGYYNF